MAVNVGTLLAELKLNVGNFLSGTRQVETATRTMTGSIAGMGKSYNVAAGAVQQYSTTMGKGAQATQQTTAAVSGLNKMLAVVFSYAAISKIIQWGSALMKIGVESEAYQARFEAVFGETADDLDRWAKANVSAFGMAEDSIKGYLANIANLMIPFGYTTDEAAEQAQTVLRLANAWTAYWGGSKTVEEATQAITKGMLGQTRGLIDLGMKLTDEALAAEVAALGLDKLTGVAKDQAEATARLNIIRDRSNVALEVEAELAKGALGEQRKLAGAIDTLKDALGALVVAGAPALTFLSAMVGSLAVLAGADIGDVFSGMWAGRMNAGQATDAQVSAERLRAQAAALVAGGVGMPQQWQRYAQERITGVPLTMTPAEIMRGMQLMGYPTDPRVIGRMIERINREVGWVAQPQFASALNVLGEHVGVTERMAGQTAIVVARAMDRAIVQPVEVAMQEAQAAVRLGFGGFANIFTAFELPDISWEELLTNAQDWADAYATVEAFMDDVGRRGVDALLLGLGSLSSQQIAAIAAIWSGKMSDLYDLFPGTHPGPNAPIGERAAGGPVFPGKSYLIGERGPELFSPGVSGNIIPGGGGGGDIIVNVGQAVGDETSIERMVTTAIRRAKLRGSSR